MPPVYRDGDRIIDVHFPKAGIDRSQATGKQPARPSVDGEYARTCYFAKNVRTYDPDGGRSRGGQRSGYSRLIDARASGSEFIIQDLSTVTGVGFPAPGGGTVQTSLSGRVVTLVAVSQGNVYVANPGDTAWTAANNATGETPPLVYSGLVYSAQNTGKLFFADGTNWCYYDPSTNTVYPWRATSGSLPVDSSNNTPRLICTWRGRTVLSGLVEDAQNWFASAVADPFNWNYSPDEPSPAQAVAGNNAPQGQVGDVITSLIPYSDDVLIFGGDSTIWMFRGDPMAGGQIDLISDAVGVAWGMPWCRDPYGTIYFFSSRTGIYSLVPGQQPLRISQGIEPLVQDINTGENVIRMLWDDRAQGLHVYVTPSDEPTAGSQHFYYEQRAGAWWTDTFRDPDMDPLCCTVLDGNRPEDRVSLIGSWDGYVRAIDHDATKDDGKLIDSEVIIGPLVTRELDEVMLKDLQAVLATSSGDVTYEVYVGSSAEAALASNPVVTGTWTKGRNVLSLVRRAGHAIYVKIRSTNFWAMELIRARMSAKGKVRGRGR